MSRTDRIVGIVLGLAIGVAAVILFVFAGGSGSIDKPSLDQPDATTAPASQPAAGPDKGDG